MFIISLTYIFMSYNLKRQSKSQAIIAILLINIKYTIKIE